MRRIWYGLVVKTAQVTQQEIDLGTGTLQVNVIGSGGKPADSTGRLIVSVFNPQDHKNAVASKYGNPINFALPAGRYDARIEYGVGLAPPSGGTNVKWINGIAIQAGQTTAQTVDLNLGEVKLNFFEASSKAVDAKNFVFYLVPPGDSGNRLVTGAFLDAVTLQLLPGTYDVIADVANTSLVRAGPVATIQVKEGQSITQTINLKLSRVHVEVSDAPGRLSAAMRVSASAFAAGTRDTSFATVSGTNPLDLIVRAGVTYDVVLKLEGKAYELKGVSLPEGATKPIQINASDFK